MAFKVFLSYSTEPEEQSIVWRLQTLAAAHGISLFVPQRVGFVPNTVTSHKAPSWPWQEQIRGAIDEADCVLALITVNTNAHVRRELSYALEKKKTIVPIVEQGAGPSAFLKRFQRVFAFNRFEGSPGRVENEVVEYLRQQKVAKENLQAVGGLVAIGMGMLLLAGLAKE